MAPPYWPPWVFLLPQISFVRSSPPNHPFSLAARIFQHPHSPETSEHGDLTGLHLLPQLLCNHARNWFFTQFAQGQPL